jgi:hypothetical protein
MKALSSERRKRHGPTRSAGTCTRLISLAATAACRIARILWSFGSSLRVEPGASALTVMPSGANSAASVRVKPMTAALLQL